MYDDDQSEAANYEITDAQIKGILIVGVCLSTLALAAFMIGFVIVRWSEGRPATTDYEPSPLAADYEAWTTETRLQEDPAKIRAELEKTHQEVLRTYATVSEEPLVYRIPIEVAMDIVGEIGFPDFKPIEAPQEEEEK